MEPDKDQEQKSQMVVRNDQGKASCGVLKSSVVFCVLIYIPVEIVNKSATRSAWFF